MRCQAAQFLYTQHASNQLTHCSYPCPQVLPVLFAVLRVCDEPLRELLLDQLVLLVMVVRQHIRRFLPDLLGLLGEFWGLSPRTQHTCLKVSCQLSGHFVFLFTRGGGGSVELPGGVRSSGACPPAHNTPASR
jgi:hypothetical protein